MTAWVFRRVAKLRRAPISIVTFVHISVHIEQLGSNWMDFNEIWHFRIFRKSVAKIQVSLKLDENKGVLYMKTNVHFLSYLTHLFVEWETFQTKVVEKIKTHILSSITVFKKSCRFWANVGKNIVEQGRPQLYCMLRTYGLHTHAQVV